MVITGNVFRRNQNICSHCKQRNLPEPIAFAKLCRLTGEYVCDGCYGASMDVLIDMEQTRSRA